MKLKDYEQMLNDAETRLDRLKALYEQWFQGLERLEPTILRKDLERRLQSLRREVPRNNTALRFRSQQLQQRYTTYSLYWKRIARQIEEGTYRRDLLRARRARVQGRQERRAGGVIELGEEELMFEDFDDFGEVSLDEMPTLPPPASKDKTPPPAPESLHPTGRPAPKPSSKKS